ncbi:MAG: hypothetical protein QME52_09545 [Bacteroidota bacterium]|nr:hypothetical protein [Bacteroidota bacterium]
MENSFRLVLMFAIPGLIILWAFAWWKIFSKAGFSGANGLFLLIPLFGIIVIFIFAFSKWPLHNILRNLNIKGIPDTDFDELMKKAIELEVETQLKEARKQYKRIIDDAQSCINVLDRSLLKIEQQHG